MAVQTQVEMPQHMVALARAQEVRQVVVALKRRVQAGEVTLRQALMDDVVANVPAMSVVRWKRRVGRERALAALRQAGIRSELRTCGQLTLRQVLALAGHFEGPLLD